MYSIKDDDVPVGSFPTPFTTIKFFKNLRKKGEDDMKNRKDPNEQYQPINYEEIPDTEIEIEELSNSDDDDVPICTFPPSFCHVPNFFKKKAEPKPEKKEDDQPYGKLEDHSYLMGYYGAVTFP